MSKLGDAISLNRKRNEEYGIGSVGATKPKSYLSQGIDSVRQGKTIPPRGTSVSSNPSYTSTGPGQTGRDLKALSSGTGPTPTLPHDKQLGSQGRRPKVEPASAYAAAAQEPEHWKPERQFSKNAGAAAHSGPSLPSDSFLPTPEVQMRVGEKQDRAGRGTGFRSGRGGSFGGTRGTPGPTSPTFNGLEQEDERIKQTQARVAEAMSRYEAARKALVQDTLPTYAASAGGRKPFEPSPVASPYAASAGALKSREEREREGRLREAGEAYAALPFPSVGERVGLTLSGAGKEYTGSMAQAGASAVDQIGLDGIIDHLSGPTGAPIPKPLLKLATAPLERKLVNAAQEFSDRATESGARDIARAQEGLDPMGKMLVKAGAAVTQMGGDAALALATGGSSMLPMLTRSFGGGVQEARAKGYSEEQQLALGLANAATEYFSERLFGGNPVYDTDVGLVNRLVGKLVKNPKVVKFLSSAPVEKITEGLEEMVSDLLNPIAEWAITGTRPEYELDQIIEDGIVGVIAAVMAGGGSKVVNKVGQSLGNRGHVSTGKESGKQKAASTGEAVTTYTIQRDVGGDVYVQIDADILKGKPREQWGKTVQDTIKSIFGSGLKLARGTVFTNRKGRGEYTNGSYTKMLERTDPGMYQDKMRMAAGSDGILKNTSDVVYEDASHERTDDIVGFNRGKIVVSVKGTGYTGDVLTAVYSDGKETFFDINNLARKTIEAATPERYAVQDGFTQADAAASNPIISDTGDSVKGEFAPEDGETHYMLKETAQAYEGKDLSSDGSVYSYEFLTSLPDMEVTSLPEVGTVQGKDGRINARTVVNLGMMNAQKVGVEKDGKIYIPNSYTSRELRLDVSSIRHGLNGDYNRLLTNARLGTVIGDLVKNAVPVNALQNKAEGVTGTYAMAGYARDSKGREFVAIITVEQRSGDVAGFEVYDVTHSINGRQKRGERVDTKSQGVYPSTNASTISISDFLKVVKQTHQSILSEDVLAQFGEERNPAGYYTGKAQFSIKDAETTAKGPSAETQTENTQPLTQADAKRFATETGTEKGLVLDDYVQKHIRREKAERLNTLAQALGVRVRFVSSIRGGTANASIKGSEVQIEKYNPNPVTYLLGHELTHRMQSLSPEAYTRFKESIRSEVEKEAQALHSLYRIRGEGIDFEGAVDEATANYAGRLLEEGPVLDEFIRRHKTDRSMLEKLLDAVRDMLSKLTGKEREKAETAEAKLLAAMEETAEKVKKSGGESVSQQNGEAIHYLLKESENRLLPYSAWRKETLTKVQGNVVINTESQLVDAINEAFENPQSKKSLHLGVIPQQVIERINQEAAGVPKELKGMLFKENREYSLEIGQEDIRHLTDGKQGMTREDVIAYVHALPIIVAEFDSAQFSYYRQGQNDLRALRFVKALPDGTYIAVEIVSRKKNMLETHNIFMQSSDYVIKKKSANSMPVQNPAQGQTSKTLDGYSSND